MKKHIREFNKAEGLERFNKSLQIIKADEVGQETLPDGETVTYYRVKTKCKPLYKGWENVAFYDYRVFSTGEVRIYFDGFTKE